MPYGAAGPDANAQLTATFAVEIDGIEVSAYKKVSIDASEWSTMSNRLGIDDLNSSTASGTKKVHVITLEQPLMEGGQSDLATLWNWHNAGASDKRSGAVIQNDREGNEVLRMTFRRAWLKKIIPPAHDAEEEAGTAIYGVEIEAPELLFEV